MKTSTITRNPTSSTNKTWRTSSAFDAEFLRDFGERLDADWVAELRDGPTAVELETMSVLYAKPIAPLCDPFNSLNQQQLKHRHSSSVVRRLEPRGGELGEPPPKVLWGGSRPKASARTNMAAEGGIPPYSGLNKVRIPKEQLDPSFPPLHQRQHSAYTVFFDGKPAESRQEKQKINDFGTVFNTRARIGSATFDEVILGSAEVEKKAEAMLQAMLQDQKGTGELPKLRKAEEMSEEPFCPDKSPAFGDHQNGNKNGTNGKFTSSKGEVIENEEAEGNKTPIPWQIGEEHEPFPAGFGTEDTEKMSPSPAKNEDLESEDKTANKLSTPSGGCASKAFVRRSLRPLGSNRGAELKQPPQPNSANNLTIAEQRQLQAHWRRSSGAALFSDYGGNDIDGSAPPVPGELIVDANSKLATKRPPSCILLPNLLPSVFGERSVGEASAVANNILKSPLILSASAVSTPFCPSPRCQRQFFTFDEGNSSSGGVGTGGGGPVECPHRASFRVHHTQRHQQNPHRNSLLLPCLPAIVPKPLPSITSPFPQSKKEEVISEKAWETKPLSNQKTKIGRNEDFLEDSSGSSGSTTSTLRSTNFSSSSGRFSTISREPLSVMLPSSLPGGIEIETQQHSIRVNYKTEGLEDRAPVQTQTPALSVALNYEGRRSDDSAVCLSSPSPQTHDEKKRSTQKQQMDLYSPPLSKHPTSSSIIHSSKAPALFHASFDGRGRNVAGFGEDETKSTVMNPLTAALREMSVGGGGGRERRMSCALVDVALPSYTCIATSIDRLLRLSSAIYSLLGTLNASPAGGGGEAGGGKRYLPMLLQEIAQKAANFCALVRQSFGPHASASVYFSHELEALLSSVYSLEQFLFVTFSSCSPSLLQQRCSADHLTVMVRKCLDQTMLACSRVICEHLAECNPSQDRLLPLALEHLIHLLLFGDELGLEAVKWGAVDELLEFSRHSNIQPKTLKLVLRTLAVLCGTSKGCLQLLSAGGLDTVLQLLLDANRPADCSVEAAGVLTQLTSPGHPFVRPTQSLQAIVLRLLALVDAVSGAEQLLLCIAALANLSQQNVAVVTELLYTYNAVLRLVRVVNRPGSGGQSIFVREQVIAVFSRMASRGYEQALIAQGAIPLLLGMLSVMDAKYADYCRRINYKAAVCLGTLAFNGLGLKAIYDNNGYNEVCAMISREFAEQKRSSTLNTNINNNFQLLNGGSGGGTTGSPLLLICASIKQRLESRYTSLLMSMENGGNGIGGVGTLV